MAERKAAAIELDEKPAEPCPQEWTGPDGKKRTRTYRRACPGVEGNPCPNRSHLRTDSTGGICAKCREALTWNGLVSAKRSREHLLELSRAGVGRRSVMEAADVGETTLQKISNGTRTRIRKNIERSILSVDVGAVAGAGLVDAGPTWTMIRHLLREGFTRGELALRLGYSRPALQIGKKKILARTELKVARFYRQIMAEGDDLADADVCSYCGVSHEQARRTELLRRMLPASTQEIVDRRPCLWSGGQSSTGRRRLNRDLHTLGATRAGDVWSMPA